MKHHRLLFTEKRIVLSADSTKEELSKYDSNYKVPILQDGNLLIWDSLAILEYISEKYLQQQGWPSDNEARAQARALSAEMHSSFYALRKEMPMNCRKEFHNINLSAAAQQDIERITALWRTCLKKYSAGGEWLFGEYSIADAMYAPVIFRFAGYNVPLGDVENTYLQNALKHPAMMEWKESGIAETEIIPEDEITT